MIESHYSLGDHYLFYCFFLFDDGGGIVFLLIRHSLPCTLAFY